MAIANINPSSSAMSCLGKADNAISAMTGAATAAQSGAGSAATAAANKASRTAESAAATPAIPPPTTTTSKLSMTGIRLSFSVISATMDFDCKPIEMFLSNH